MSINGIILSFFSAAEFLPQKSLSPSEGTLNVTGSHFILKLQ